MCAFTCSNYLIIHNKYLKPTIEHYHLKLISDVAATKTNYVHIKISYYIVS